MTQFKEAIQRLEGENISYMIVGSIAFIIYGERRRRITIWNDFPAYVASPEDIIIKKLEY